MLDIAFLVYPGYSLMALAIVAGFEVANSMVDPEPYNLYYVSETGGLIKTSAGLSLETERFTDRPFDTLVVGGATAITPSTPGLIAFMRDAPKRHRRIAAVCTGAFVLAEAGLLCVPRYIAWSAHRWGATAFRWPSSSARGSTPRCRR